MSFGLGHSDKESLGLFYRYKLECSRGKGEKKTIGNPIVLS